MQEGGRPGGEAFAAAGRGDPPIPAPRGPASIRRFENRGGPGWGQQDPGGIVVIPADARRITAGEWMRCAEWVAAAGIRSVGTARTGVAQATRLSPGTGVGSAPDR